MQILDVQCFTRDLIAENSSFKKYLSPREKSIESTISWIT